MKGPLFKFSLLSSLNIIIETVTCIKCRLHLMRIRSQCQQLSLDLSWPLLASQLERTEASW